MERKENTKVISCRVTNRFAKLIKKYCSLDAHVNTADLVRDALREKIRRDSPHLYLQLFKLTEGDESI